MVPPDSTMPDKIELTKMVFNLMYRYLIFTGLFYLVFYLLPNKTFLSAKIQQRYPLKKSVFIEIKNSFISMLIFGVVIFFTIWAGKKGWTLAYTPMSLHGKPYFFISILLMIILHDTYFYWTHRLLHWKPLFKAVHKTHHLSINPTPFAAYAFHPVEAVIEVGIIPLVAFKIPPFGPSIAIFSVYSLLLNVIGHLGFEIFPKGFATHKLFKWHNTSTHHNMHHRLVKYNFGLYFNFWDRIMGTNHPLYEESFNAVVETRRKGKENIANSSVTVE
jgi:lathosterol oxidase